ncbi:MAG: hypothetical protein B7Z80_04065 [Rhodospirillales bacterium 20-64-7]|nr:MAG: hypothetical protein B7Z80_04065 [Rhodospirillales bacterium 20-64-7]
MSFKPRPLSGRRIAQLRRGGRRGLVVSALTLAGLTGCAKLPDGGMALPTALTQERLHKNVSLQRTSEDREQAEARAKALSRRPLSAESAVQLALINNRGLQAAYHDLGVQDAIRFQQSLPPNPSISVSLMNGPAEMEMDRQIVTDILSLVTLKERSEIAATRFRQAQYAAALETFRLATETRRAFYTAVAAEQTVRLLDQAASAAGSAAAVAERLNASGAVNKLDRSREEAFHLEILNQAATARQKAIAAREQLVRLLGFTSETKLKLPSYLPKLPPHLIPLRSAEQATLDRRLDIQIARQDMDALARSYGLTKSVRFINVLEGGYSDKFTRDNQNGKRAWSPGATLSLEVPLFDFGEGRLREAQEKYLAAVNRLEQKAIDARSEIREAYKIYRSAYTVANSYQRKLLPLRSSISDEMMLQYGAMQIDVFSLLIDARQRIAANVASVEASRDFWIADVNLSAASFGVSFESPSNGSAAPPADTSSL